jgi:hypothetical protein
VGAFGIQHRTMPDETSMSSENLHAPRERLSAETLNLHFAIVSLQEELDAIDWYRQRADDTADEALKGLLLHNMREEIEHAAMLLEWLRRADADIDRMLRAYLFSDGPIIATEGSARAGIDEASAAAPRLSIGSLKGR